MITYKELEKDAEVLSKKIDLENGYLKPPTFNENIKYLFMGLNPSNKEDEKTTRDLASSDTDKILTFGNFKKCFKKKEIKKMTPDLIYPLYFDGLVDLVNFDTEIFLFWQNKIQFNIIMDKNATFRESLERLKEFANGTEMEGYISFCDLLYVRSKNQKKIVKCFESKEKINGIAESTERFFFNQLDYYHPKNLIVINAFASKLVQKFCGENEDKSFFKYGGTNIFLSGMISAQHALDVHNRIRLKNEIKEKNDF